MSDKCGFSLVEIVVVVTIIGILSSIAIPMLGSRIKNQNVKSCAQNLAADIRQARASALREGRRAQLVITDTGSPKDLGNGSNLLWLSFLDTYPPTRWFVAGDTVLSSSGSCASNVKIETISGIPSLTADPAGSVGLSMWFSASGTLKETAIDKSIIFTAVSDNSYKVRISVTSLTGYLRVQTCTKSGAVSCANPGDWKDI